MTNNSASGYQFEVVRRNRVYSEPDLELQHHSLNAAFCYAPVDYNQKERVVKRFRRNYSRWRQGKAQGPRLNLEQLGTIYRSIDMPLGEDDDFEGLTLESTPVNVERNEGTLGFIDGLLNNLNYNLGLAILAVPFSFSRLGWICVPILIPLCALAWWSAHAIGRLLRESGSDSYAGICSFAMPESCGAFATEGVRIVQVLELFSYYVNGNVALHDLLADTIGTGSLSKLTLFLIIVALSTPMVFVRSLRFLAWSSAIGLTCYILALMLTLQECLFGDTNVFNPAPTVGIHGTMLDFLSIISMLLLLFAGHAALPAIYFRYLSIHLPTYLVLYSDFGSMKVKSDFGRVINYTFAILVGIVLLIGCACYATYGNQILPIVTLSIKATFTKRIAVCLLLVKVYSANFLMIFPLVHEVEIVFARVVVATKSKWHRLTSFDSEIQTPLLSLSESIPETVIEHVRNTEHNDPLFETFAFTGPANEMSFERIHTDPITRFNMRRQAPGRAEVSHPLLAAFAVRNRCETINEIKDDTKNKAIVLEIGVRILVIASGCLCAYLVANIELVMSLAGSLFAVNVSITFPAALSFFTVSNQLSRVCSVLISTLGVGMMFASLYATLT